MPECGLGRYLADALHVRGLIEPVEFLGVKGVERTAAMLCGRY